MAKQFILGARRAQVPSIIIPAPQIGGTTCYVATQCSITPCVIPVASAVAAVPTLPNAVTRCPLGDRVPRSFRVIVAR
jgi:hypothetical protein